MEGDACYYHCVLCNYSTKAKLNLIQHVRSMKHQRSESLRKLQRLQKGLPEEEEDLGSIFTIRKCPSSDTGQTLPSASMFCSLPLCVCVCSLLGIFPLLPDMVLMVFFCWSCCCPSGQWTNALGLSSTSNVGEILFLFFGLLCYLGITRGPFMRSQQNSPTKLGCHGDGKGPH